MSIVTLRSTEDFGAQTTDTAAAVNFQNFFKDPIYFNKDDQIQITSVTINQQVNEIVVSELDNRLEYMLLPAMTNLGDVPFFNRHSVFLSPGSYAPTALAAEVKKQLNDSVIAQVYEFDFAYDSTATPPGFVATYKQLVAPAAANTGLQGLRYDGTGKIGGKATALNTPTNIAEFPLAPVAPGSNNQYAVNFGALNNSLEPPTITQQLALLTPTNLNAQLLDPDTDEFGGTNLISGYNYQYIFEKGIYANGGEQTVDMTANLTLDNINLAIHGDNTSIPDYIQIENDGAVGTTKVYEVLTPGTSGDVLTHDYELDNIANYAGKPLTMSLKVNSLTPPTTAITGINNSANNTITTNGTGYIPGTLYTAQVVPTVPGQIPAVIHCLTVNGTGGITSFEVIYPGDGFAATNVLTISANGTAASGTAQITIGTGGIRNDAAGTNNAAGNALTVGSTYKVFFPQAAFANPVAGSPSFPAPTKAELTAAMNAIDLRVKIDAIDATSRKVTAMSFDSIALTRFGTTAGAPLDFARLLNILTYPAQGLGVVDNNGSFTAVSTSLVQINTVMNLAARTAAIIKFTSRPDALMGLSTNTNTNDPTYPNNPMPSSLGNGGNDAFDLGVFSAFESKEIPGAGGIPTGLFRAVINTPSITNLQEMDLTTGAPKTNGKIISKVDSSTLAVIPLTGTASFGRVNNKIGFIRNSAREAYEGSAGIGEAGKQGLPEIADILVETFNGYQKKRIFGFGETSTIQLEWQSYNMLISVADFPATATSQADATMTRRIVFAQNVKAGANFSAEANDRLKIDLDNLNNMSFVYSQPTVGAFTPLTFTLAPTTNYNTIRETIFPLNPLFAFSASVPLNRTNPAGGGAPDQFRAGIDYLIEGKYDTKEVPVQDTIRTSTSMNGGNAYTNLFHPTGTGLGFSETTSAYTFLSQSGAGSNPACLQLPITYTFGEIQSANIDTTNANPVPVGSLNRDKVGFTQFEPNLARTNFILGFEVVENESATSNLNLQNKATVSNNAIDLGLPPSMVVEFPDFNIQGYSGAAQDKFKIVATIPTEEWGTSVTDGTLHYKPLFPLPIDVNLPEDRELYSMSVRLRNLDGTLAKNLRNPTTVTFYKKPREGKELERLLNRALQSRSENQDQKLSMGNSQFPRV